MSFPFEQKPVYVYKAGAKADGTTDGVFLTAVCVVDDYQTLRFGHGFYAPGTFTLVINKNTLYASEFQVERVIRIGEDNTKCGTITSVKQNIDETGAISETFTITGYELPGWLDLRLTTPPSGQAYYVLSASTPVETAIKSVVSYNMGPTAVDSARKDLTMTIATDLGRGGNFLLSTRDENLLNCVSQAALAMNVGLLGSLDLPNKKWIFDIGIGLDRTVGQSTNPRAVFAVRLDTIKSAEYTQSIAGLKTMALVAGQGEGADRVMRTVPASPPSGRARRELFVDARDLSLTSSLDDRGAQKLAEVAFTEFTTLQPLAYSQLKYGVDYNVGDRVTVQQFGVSVDLQITSAEETWKQGDYGISLGFDRAAPSITTQAQGTAVALQKTLAAIDPPSPTIKPLSGAISANTNYSSMPTAEGTYRVFIPAAYLVASSGGPYTLTLSNGVGTSGVINILAHGDTLTSGDLLFDVYVGATGNITIGAYTFSGTSTNGNYVIWSDGTMECYWQDSGTFTTSSALGALWSASKSVTYPGPPFISKPILSPAILSTTTIVWGTNDSASSVSTTSLYAISTSNTGTGVFAYHAIGRWKA